MWKRRKFKKKSSGRLLKITLVTLIIFTSVLIFFSFRLGLFAIKQMEIEGDQLLCAQQNEIESSLGLFGQNFFTVSTEKISKTLKDKFICIKNINLTKVFPNKARIKIISRQPAALLVSLKEKEASISALTLNVATPSAESISDYFLIDEEGVVFAKSTDQLDIPKIFIYDSRISLGRKFGDSLIKNFLKILGKIKTFGVEAKENWVNDSFFIVTASSMKTQVIFDLNGDIDIQLASLQLILDKAKINRGTIPSEDGIDSRELEFIDLRFDKPVIRFVPEKNGKR